MTKKKIAVQTKSELALVKEDTLDLSEVMQDSGAGSENVTSDDTKTPFIRIIQALSPQHQKSEPAYIAGAEQGMLYNTITDQLYSLEKGASFIPVHFETRYIEKKRKEEGDTVEKFVMDHGVDNSVIQGLKKEGFAYITS